MERIAFSLESIRFSLLDIVGYVRAQEQRQKFYASFVAGITPALTKYVSDALGPKHPDPSPFGPVRSRPLRIHISRSANPKADS
jgi:hypothetical protein